MKKALLFSLLCFSCSFAQEIKIKKNIISLDGIEVAKVDNKKRLYTISTLTDVPKFSVEMKIFPLVDGTNVYYCEITEVASGKKKEILDEGESQSLSFEKSIVASVTHGKNKFLTTNGIDEAYFAEFINNSQGGLLKDLEDKNVAIEAQFKTEMTALEDAKILISKDGTIYQQIMVEDEKGIMVNKNVTLGFIVKIEEKDAQGFSVFRYQITNKKNVLIANWYYASRSNPVTNKLDKEFILTADNQFYKVKYDSIITSSFGTDLSKDGNAKKIVAKLFFNNYIKKYIKE